MADERIRDPEVREVLLSWRKRLFYSVYTTFLFLITIPFIVSTQTSIEQGNWFLLGLHATGFVCAVLIVTVRRIPYSIAALAGVIIMFLVGVTTLAKFGPIGSGRIWLFAFSVLATIVYGMRGGIITSAMNAAVLIVTGFIMNAGGFPWTVNPDVTLRMWMITGITYVFLNGVVVVSMAVLVNALEKRLIRENELRRKVSLAGEELEESEEKLSQAIKGSAVPTFLIDGNHVITHWNDACSKATGKTADEMVGTRDHWVVFGEVKQPVPADIVLMRKQGKMPEDNTFQSLVPSRLIPGALEGEVRVSAGGKERILHCTAAPLRNRAEEAVGAIQTFMDMTERRRVESQLQHSQKLDAVGRLAGGVAHDFNNMLGVIIGHTEIMRECSVMDPSYRESLEEISNAALRSADLTRQLLAFARKQDVEHEVLNMNVVIRELSKMLRRLLSEDISLEMNLGKNIPLVMCDRSQIDQILANLCVNARDAIDGMGVITIETSAAVLDEDYCSVIPDVDPGSYVLLAVSDTGMGMNRETMKRVFEPFFTTKEIGRGTGLGLSTVHGIIRQNGGHIAVYSEPGTGSVFKVYLPAYLGVESKKKKKDNPPVMESGRGEQVLLVEDEPSIRNLASMMLVKMGYRVVEAETPARAMEIAKNPGWTPELLITDVVMPGMNGKDLSDRLREMIPGLRVIFISGYTADVVASRGVVDEGCAFLAKPFTRRELGTKIRQVLNG